MTFSKVNSQLPATVICVVLVLILAIAFISIGISAKYIVRLAHIRSETIRIIMKISVSKYFSSYPYPFDTEVL